MTNMKASNIPEIRRQRRRLAEWLAEWRLEQALSRADISSADDCGGPAVRNATTIAAQACPATGQIRLLFPDHAATRRRPLYVLILNQATPNEYLIVPFGMFATPAIPGEWRTGLRCLPLRVLCVWNTRQVNCDRLQRAWHPRDLDGVRWAQARQMAADVFVRPPFFLSRTSLTADIRPVPANSLGPPLGHPLDPRRQYLAAESERLDALGPPPATLCGDVCWRGQPLPGAAVNSLDYSSVHEPLLLKAAEKRGDYASRQ